MILYFNKKTILTVCILFFSSIITFISCADKGNISEDEFQIQFQRKSQLTNIYKNEIVPLNTAFITSAEALKIAVSTFVEETTQLNLESARAKWIDMLKVWKRLELYNLGAIEDSFIHFEINRWSTNAENIEIYISGTETINETFINSIGSSSKGISALEYLLFSSKDNQTVLNTFTLDANFERRLDYLEALSSNLITKANNLQTLWTADETGFTSSLENGISGTQSQLTNAMITLTEEVVISKLGNALGDNSGGVIDVEALEAYRSKLSLIIIQEHLTALNRCYEGAFIENSIKWGYDDYLNLISNESLDATIVEAFNKCQEKIDAISIPLSETLISNPEKVVALQNAFTNLLVYFKVDMANAIGTTVTINDNDGD